MLESHHHATAIQPLRSALMIWLLAELAAGFSHRVINLINP
ncbi:MAG: hypothetical protein ACAF42_03690 [Limnothrix sp. BL-A-16]